MVKLQAVNLHDLGSNPGLSAKNSPVAQRQSAPLLTEGSRFRNSPGEQIWVVIP